LGIMTRHLLAMPLLAKARIAQALYVRVWKLISRSKWDVIRDAFGALFLAATWTDILILSLLWRISISIQIVVVYLHVVLMVGVLFPYHAFALVLRMLLHELVFILAEGCRILSSKNDWVRVRIGWCKAVMLHLALIYNCGFFVELLFRCTLWCVRLALDQSYRGREIPVVNCGRWDNWRVSRWNLYLERERAVFLLDCLNYFLLRCICLKSLLFSSSWHTLLACRCRLSHFLCL
jgi:hypothetical protein